MKEDWWVLEPPGQLPVRPRPELRAEFQLEVGRDFNMYRLDSFVLEAARFGRAKLAKLTLTEAESHQAAAIKAAKARPGDEGGPPRAKIAPPTDEDVAFSPKNSGDRQQKREQ